MKFVFLCLVAVSLQAAPATVKFTLTPDNPLLFGKGSVQRLVAQVTLPDGTTRDVTAETTFLSGAPDTASVDKDGTVRALSNGGATITATHNGRTARTTALVQQAEGPLPTSFAGDILPVFTKYGCNGGSCHGALNGQSGFKLSLFGYEPLLDYEMVVKKHDGRRLDLANPEKSLILLKPTFAVKHGGGKLIRKGSPDYNALVAWIAAGAARNPADERRMVSLRVTPGSTVLFGAEAAQRLLVTARFSNGTESDVTELVNFKSNDDSIVKVDAKGVITASRPGETAIVVRGPGVTGVAKVGVVLDNTAVASIPEANFIDRFVNAKLRKLSIPPSGPTDDATFLRRASLDIIGVIPTAEEVRTYLADASKDKRAKAVDALLKRTEYADHWATYWGDHLNNTKQQIYNKGPYAFTEWLNKAFLANVPYDEFARRLLVSSGNMYDTPATSYYPLMKKEQDLASITSQLFLGISIDCARCHNHPLERWTQDDYNGMAAFFSQVRYKNQGPRNNERTLYLDFERQFQHPDSKLVYLPKPLDGPQMPSGEWVDRRELLTNWLTSPKNPYFAKALVNRMWRNFMGRGFVEPVDDFRATNPPTNEPLLAALAQDFIDHKYDLHHLIRRITSSNAYQLSSEPKPGNKADTMAYSRFYPRRMIAEQIVDSIALATGVDESFNALYPGTRAAQLPEPEIESYVMEVFDRPSRQLVCERKSTPTLNQALHLISGDTIQNKVLASPILAANRQPAESVDDLYLRTVSRFPTPEERQMAAKVIATSGDPRRGLEDVFWALLNSKEFLYNH